MRRNEFLAKQFTALSRADLVAKAYSDYFAKVYSRQLNKTADIFNGEYAINTLDDEERNDPFITFPLNGENLRVKVSEVKNAVTEKFNENLDDYSLMNVTLLDYESETEKVVNIKELSDILGQQNDTTYVTWQGFKAIADKTTNAADSFINTVNLTLSSKTADVIQSVNGIYDMLTNANLSDMDKINSLSDFTGVTKAISDPENILNETDLIEISKYTGQNPMYGWLNGIDINWNKVGSVIMAPTIFAIKLINSVVSTVVKGVGKLFSWVGNWFNKTFVNPIDYEESNKTIGFFSIPLKVYMPLEANFSNISDKNQYQKNINLCRQKLLGGSPSIMNFSNAGTCTQVAAYDNDDGIFITQYFKPLDPEGVYNIMKRFIGENGSISNLDFEQYFNMLNSLQMSDLSMNSKSSEIDVFLGLSLSRLFDDVVKTTMAYAQQYMDYDAGADDVPPGHLNWRAELSSPSDGFGFNAIELIWDFLKSIYYQRPDDYYIVAPGTTSRINRYNFELWTIPTNQLIVRSNGSGSIEFAYFSGGSITNQNWKNTVTNVDFIHILSDQAFKDQDGSNISNSYHWKLMTLNDINKDTTKPYYGFYKLTVPTDLINSSTQVLQSSPYVSLIAMDKFWNDDLPLNYSEENMITIGAYKRSDAIIEDITARVKTDEENAQAVGAALTKIAVGVAITIAAVVMTVAVVKLKSYARNITAVADTAAFNYGDAIAKGKKEDAAAQLKIWKSARLKSNITNSVLGNANKSTASALSGVIENYSNTTNDLSPVLNLLK